MPTVLSDPSPTFYAFLGIMVIVLAVIYVARRQRGDLIRLLLGIVILAGVIVIDRMFESPREESSRKVQEMAAASKAKHMDDVAKHICESFDYNGKTKSQLLDRIRGAQVHPEYGGVDVSGFNRGDFVVVDDSKVKVGFEVWPSGFGLPEYRRFCWATFVKEPDGQFRMQTFDLWPKRPGLDEKPDVPPPLR